MKKANINLILQTYIDRKDKKYVSKLVTNSKIEENDYNLSVSTYVEQKDTREVVDITELNKKILSLSFTMNSAEIFSEIVSKEIKKTSAISQLTP